MLNSMRTLSKSILAKLLMILLVVSFGVWGVGDVLRSSGPSYAAEVGHDTISVAEFQQQRSLMARQLEGMGIHELPPGKLEFTVIRQLVQEKLTLLTMEEMGLYVNEALVGKSIAEMPEFKDKQGRFSSSQFKTLLARQHLSEPVFIGQLKREIAGKFLIDSMSLDDAALPASVLALEAMTNGETRDAVLLTVPATAADAESDEAALKTYYNEHKDTDYQRPETRTLEYVVLTPAEIDALVEHSITDAMLADAAKDQPNLEKNLLRLKLAKEQREDVLRNVGNTVEDELAAGKSMAEGFRKAGINATPRTLNNVTADMAKTSGDDVIRTVAEQGFGLSEGEISRLISTPKGTLLMVSAKKINAAAPKPYEEVKADVASHLAKQLAADHARLKAQQVKQALLKSPDWQAVADENHLSSRIVSRIARPSSPREVDGVPAALQQSVFQHAVGEVAGPLALPNGDQLVAYVLASHVPAIDPASAKPTKETAPISSMLSSDIENRAYRSFEENHKVIINPDLLRAPPAKERE